MQSEPDKNIPEKYYYSRLFLLIFNGNFNLLFLPSLIIRTYAVELRNH